MSAHAVVLPPPLVRPTRHPLKWVTNHLKLLVGILVLAHLGTLIVVALYYGVFETWHPITEAWHDTVSDGYTRHMLRDVAEGLLGGCLAQQIVWNHYRRRVQRAVSGQAPLHRLDRVELALRIPNLKSPRRLRGWQLVEAPLLVLVYAIPGFVVAFVIAKLTHAHLSSFHVSSHAAAWGRIQSLWTANWDKKLIGFGASLFFGRRPMRKVYDDVQLYFARRRAAAGRRPRFWHPPTYAARVNELLDSGGAIDAATVREHDRLLRVMLRIAIPLGVALAGFGYYVLGYIAKGTT